ncbi:hypothetical protein HDV02_002678 [Globomyces sp. JEL0801]|nr:hypothetical protein HDV02_002678 [Globomyces sp. JEL0801]
MDPIFENLKPLECYLDPELLNNFTINVSSISPVILQQPPLSMESFRALTTPPLSPKYDTQVPDRKHWRVVKTLDNHEVFECPYPVFSRPYNLKEHYRCHLGFRPFSCPEPGCSSTFTRKHDLKRHSYIHGEKLFKCSHCEKSFSRREGLATHLKPTKSGRQSVCAMMIQINQIEQGRSIKATPDISP